MREILPANHDFQITLTRPHQHGYWMCGLVYSTKRTVEHVSIKPLRAEVFHKPTNRSWSASSSETVIEDERKIQLVLVRTEHVSQEAVKILGCPSIWPQVIWRGTGCLFFFFFRRLPLSCFFLCEFFNFLFFYLLHYFWLSLAFIQFGLVWFTSHCFRKSIVALVQSCWAGLRCVG